MDGDRNLSSPRHDSDDSELGERNRLLPHKSSPQVKNYESTNSSLSGSDSDRNSPQPRSSSSSNKGASLTSTSSTSSSSDKSVNEVSGNEDRPLDNDQGEEGVEGEGVEGEGVEGEGVEGEGVEGEGVEGEGVEGEGGEGEGGEGGGEGEGGEGEGGEGDGGEGDGGEGDGEPGDEEPNREYRRNCPIVGRCSECCSKCVFKHNKGCVCLGVTVALVFLIISLGCLASAITVYFVYFNTRPANTTTLYIVPQTVMEVDLWEYNMDTLHLMYITSTGAMPSDTVEIELAAAHKTRCTNTNVSPNSISYKKGERRSLLRQWTTKPLDGVISTNTSQVNGICWSWGNLTHPPQYGCEEGNGSGIHCNGQDIATSPSLIYDRSKPETGGADLVLISFCTDEDTNVTIDITECLPSPDPNSYRILFVNDDDVSQQDSVIIEFSDPLFELFDHSRLFINTQHMNTDGLQIELQSTGEPNSALVWGIGVGLFCLFLVLAIICLVMAGVVRRYRHKEYITFGCFCRDRQQQA